MHHFFQLLKACFYTALIIGVPTVIATGGNVPPQLLTHPAFQFAIIFVFAYAAGPVISDFMGHHVGTSLFFPNKANLDHPTISHIITLSNKRFYKEAQEELRMLSEIAPTDFRAYKMLLQNTAIHLKDRSLFDMYYRKGMQNLLLEEEKEFLKRYRDELISNNSLNGEDWIQTKSIEPAMHSRHFYINRKKHREKPKQLITLHSATLPPRENKLITKCEDLPPKDHKKEIVPHHFQQYETKPHNAPLLPEVHTIILEKSEDSVASMHNRSLKIDSSIEHFDVEKSEVAPSQFRFQRR